MNEFIELISNLNQEQIGHLLDYAIELKTAEILSTVGGNAA